jgi:hypothetical protein
MIKTRKNRKKFSREAAIPSPFFMALGVGMLIFFVYIWLDQRCEALGRRISQLEGQKVELQRQVKQERSRWESAKSLEQVERLLQRHHVAMTWPDERNIVRIRRTAEEPSAAEAAPARRQFARAGGIAND